ncbi:MAG: hypothetical protein PVF47_10655 [Anaerolineae bacterium]|jgi:hypothetical protein
MIKIGKQSKLGSSDILTRAVAFFGPTGLGMKILEQDDCCARFQGAGGYVSVVTASTRNKKGSQVMVQGFEWDPQIQQFITSI